MRKIHQHATVLMSILLISILTMFSRECIAQELAGQRDCEKIRRDVEERQARIGLAKAAAFYTQSQAQQPGGANTRDQFLAIYQMALTQLTSQAREAVVRYLNERIREAHHRQQESDGGVSASRGEITDNERAEAAAAVFGLSHLSAGYSPYKPSADQPSESEMEKDLAALTKKLEDCTKKGPEIPSPSSSTTIDACVVGTWRSESVTIVGHNQGGAGIVMSITADGIEKIDYDGMQPMSVNRFATNLWMGKASGHVSASDGKITVKTVESAELVYKLIDAQGKMRKTPLSKLGPASAGTYSCDKTTLTLTSGAQITKFIRQETKN